MDYVVRFYTSKDDCVGRLTYSQKHYDTIAQVNNEVWDLVESVAKLGDTFLVLDYGSVRILSIERWEVGF